MSDVPPVSSPDETVADQIVRRLIAAGLLPQQYAKYTKQQLANGTLRAEDWRLLAEKALEVTKRENEHE